MEINLILSAKQFQSDFTANRLCRTHEALTLLLVLCVCDSTLDDNSETMEASPFVIRSEFGFVAAAAAAGSHN